MNTNGILFCVPFFVCVVTRTFGQSRGDVVPDLVYTNEAGQILNTIFHKYKPEVPPRKNYPDPVMLSVNLNVLFVSSLDVVGQTLESTVDLEVTWKDSRLSWYPQTVFEMTIDQTKIWTPVLFIDNSVGSPNDVHTPKYVIKGNGEIYMYRRLQLKTFCETNLTATEEDCEIILGSHLLNSKIIDFDMESSACNVSESTHALQVSVAGNRKHLEQRSMLKENATFPEFICTLHVQHTGCCTGTSMTYSNSNGVECLMLSLNLVLFIMFLVCLF